jgi:hypothetical protein
MERRKAAMMKFTRYLVLAVLILAALLSLGISHDTHILQDAAQKIDLAGTSIEKLIEGEIIPYLQQEGIDLATASNEDIWGKISGTSWQTDLEEAVRQALLAATNDFYQKKGLPKPGNWADLVNAQVPAATRDIVLLLLRGIVLGRIESTEEYIKEFKELVEDIARDGFISLEGELVTGEIKGVVELQLRDYLGAYYSTEDWDRILEGVVKAVREQVLGNAPWDEKEILAKIISIYTGLTTQEILADPWSARMEEAVIERVPGEWQPFLYAALRRVQSERRADLEQQVAQLSTRLENLSRQLDALEQSIDDLRNRKDFLALALAAVALLLGLAALALTMRRRRKPG